MESAATPAFFNLADPAFLADPFPYYQRLLKDSPVCRTSPQSWLICGYTPVLAILTDDRRAAKVPEKTLQAYPAGPFRDYNRETLLFKDPPDYQRLRGAVSGGFTPSAIAGLTTTVQGIVDEVLDALEGKREFDLMTDFAAAIPHQVIARIMGIPRQDIALFRHWSEITSPALEPIATPEMRQRAEEAVNEFTVHVREMIRRRSAEPPTPDLVGCLIAQLRSGRISEDEAIANIPFFYASGSETTPDLIANAFDLLLSNPASLEALRRQPGLLDNALEEFLRLRPPAHLIHRFATADIEWDGQRLAQGDSMTLCLAAANRDPAQFTRPDDLDLLRPAKSNRHLSFGSGTRHCMGSSLARLEGRLAIGSFLARYPRIRLLRPPKQRPGLIFRGFSELWVSVD